MTTAVIIYAQKTVHSSSQIFQGTLLLKLLTATTYEAKQVQMNS
jgi:hypothetical protein